jgi:competence protein ComEC
MGWTWWGLGDRPAVFPALAGLLGALSGPWLEVAGWCWLGAAALGLAAALWRAGRPGGLLLGLASAWALGAGLAASAVEVDLPPLGTRVLIEGVVEERGQRMLHLNVHAVDGVPARLRATLGAEPMPPVLPGQRVRVEARLRHVQEAANPGEWSRGAWAWLRGQPVSGTFHPARLVQLTPAPAWRLWLEGARASLRGQAQQLAADEASAAFFLTLASGERAALGEELEDVFARSGLAHVLSVSGLHVAVLALAVYGALRWLLSRRMSRLVRLVDPRALAAPLAVPLVWSYVVFTGLQAPAVRSALMSTLVLAAAALRRRSDPLNAIAVAALVMVVLDPAAPFDLSVQLSFVAVLALVLLTPTLRGAIPLPLPAPDRERGLRLLAARAREAVVQTFCASLAVTLATGPLVMAAFHRVSLAGLVSNVVTLPLSGALTVLAASSAAVHVVAPALSAPLVWLGVQLSRAFVGTAHVFAEVPFGTAELPSPGPALAVLWWLGLAALVFARGRWRGLAALTPIALALHVVGPRPATGLEVTFLSVGHGDAVVLSSDGHHALIDGGGVPRGHDTGRRFVLPFLRQRRIERLEFTALSHAHPDHALGLASVLEELPTRRLLLPAGSEEGPLVSDLLVAAGDARVDRLEVGSPPFSLGAARVEVLGPPVDRSALESENDRSLVLRVVHGDVSVLLTGDLEAAGEAALVAGPATIVKAPHHGSDTSSTPELVAATRPRHVVFCVGRHNRFGFPRADVVARWEAAGARCHRTDLDGAVTFRSDGRDVEVQHFGPVLERRGRRPLRRE